jgi:hypothetical protein
MSHSLFFVDCEFHYIYRCQLECLFRGFHFRFSFIAVSPVMNSETHKSTFLIIYKATYKCHTIMCSKASSWHESSQHPHLVVSIQDEATCV